MGMAMLSPRVVQAVDWLSKIQVTKQVIQGIRTGNGSIASRIIPDGQTFVCLSWTVQTVNGGSQANGEVEIRFGGVRAINVNMSNIQGGGEANNSNNITTDVRGFSFDGDGIKAVGIEITSAGGMAAGSALVGYERNT